MKRQFKRAGKCLLQHTGSKTFYLCKRIHGRPTRESLATTNREQAELLRDQRIKELVRRPADSEIALGAAVTFEDLATQYLLKVEQLPEAELKAGSKKHITECVGIVEKTFSGWKSPVRKITALACVDWGDKQRARYSGPRFNAMVTALRKILDRAVLAGALESNPGMMIARASVDTHRAPPPSWDLFERLIDTIKKQAWGRSVRAAKVVRFLAYTGLRINEARMILKTDVVLRKPAGASDPDQSYGRIAVRKEITKRDAHDVPIFKECRPIVDDWLKKDARGEFLMPVKECYRALRSACKKLGIEGLSHHDFRHLFATHCCEMGVDKAVVAKWLGHRDATLVHKVYGHVRDDHKRNEVKKVSFTSAA